MNEVVFILLAMNSNQAQVFVFVFLFSLVCAVVIPQEPFVSLFSLCSSLALPPPPPRQPDRLNNWQPSRRESSGGSRPRNGDPAVSQSPNPPEPRLLLFS